MTISKQLLADAIKAISSVSGMQMDAQTLAEDVVLVALVYDEDQIFNTAITNIVDALNLIVKNKNIGTPLVGNLSGWISFHFQSQRTQGHPADLRIAYQDIGTAIQVKGFGNRFLPSDFYKKLYGR